MNFASKLFRIISLVIVLISGSYTAWLLLSESTNPFEAILYLVPGPIIMSLGIIISFLSKTRPAILRIETTIGLLLTAIGGIFGAFSIGGILITMLFIVVPLLIADTLVLGFADKIQLRANDLRSKLMLVIALICLVIFLLILRVAIGFAILALPMLLPWGVLLFFSITSYLPKQKLTVYLVGLVVLLTIVSLWYFQSKQPDLSATISETTNSYSSSGIHGTHRALGSESGGTGSENVDFEYQELNKHNDELSFDFNDKTYLIKPSTRVLFYGLLSNKKARYIELKLKNGSIIKGKVAYKQFVLQTHKPHAQKYLEEIVLADGQKTILKEKIEPLDDWENF